MECDVCCGSRSSLAPRPSRSAATRRCASSFGVPILPSVEGASGAVGHLRRSAVRRRSESTIAAPQTLDRISVTTSVMLCAAGPLKTQDWHLDDNDGTHYSFYAYRHVAVNVYRVWHPERALLASRGKPDPACSPSRRFARRLRARRRPACTPPCQASRIRARTPSTVVISTPASRLRAEEKCRPDPSPCPSPSPSPSPDPNPNPHQVPALHLHHGARLGAHAAHDLVQRRAWRAEHVRPFPRVRPLPSD